MSQLMDEDSRRLRGIDMALDLFRNRWTYPVLTVLSSEPLHPAQLIARINKENASYVDLARMRTLHEKTLFETLRRMESQGLIACKNIAGRPGSATQRELTSMSRELLISMHRMAEWASDYRDQLTITVREHEEPLQRNPSLANSGVAGPPSLTPEQSSWRSIGVALTILRLRWSFSVIYQLSHGPQHPTGVAAAINARVDKNRDIMGKRTLSAKVLWDTLHRLIDAGLVNHQPRAGQFASTAQCTLTARGYSLLGALSPIGTWATGHEEHLTATTRKRRGFIDLSAPGKFAG
ncbi:winged helix-turn-helix transcriptional regulator [Streptomyces sp. NBC_00075]|uniref:Winged helix-turn-helix transcriptional regulator n=1 Tax=Streptomyces sp. NBC_00093 TaxID=2975649 RepID=A0AAU2A652_9ACTN